MSSTHDRNKDVFSLKNQHPQTFEILSHTEGLFLLCLLELILQSLDPDVLF